MPRTRTIATRRVVVLGLVAGLALGACRDPDLTPANPGQPSGTEVVPLETPSAAADIPDPRDRDLDSAGRELLATLTDVRTGFDSLTRATTVADAEPIVLRLRATLAADPRWTDLDNDGEADDLGVRPLLPGPLISREETIDYGDVFNLVLNAARDSGTKGAAWIEVLRDPVVSDLGAWQRDPAGMLRGIEAAVANVRDVPAAEQAVQELDGEGPKALAWALLAVRATDLAAMQAYGERGAVHVGLMVDAVAPLVEG